GMGELLPQLGGEAEVSRDFGCPGAGGVLIRRPIKRAVDLNGIEILGVKAKLLLVGELRGIEHTIPRALTLGIAPARSTDVQAGRRGGARGGCGRVLPTFGQAARCSL